MKAEGKTLLIAVALSAAAVLVWFGLYAEGGSRPFDDKPFSQQAWRSGNTRLMGRMADDLIQHHLRTGLTTNEVFELLGLPDKTFLRSGTVRYYIGSWSTFRGGRDANWIQIDFDAKGRLISAHIEGG